MGSILPFLAEKWSRKNIFKIQPCTKPFSENLFTSGEFLLKTTNSVKNDLLRVWRDLKKQLCGRSRCDK